MLKYLLTVLIAFSTCGLFAQDTEPDFKTMLDSIHETEVPQVFVEEFINMNRNGLYILDAREQEEFDVSHIKNARNVGYLWFDMRKVYDIPSDANIVVYCAIGTRSEKIVRKILNAGYKNVYSLHGGLFEWVNSGQPVYKLSGVQTSEIHTYRKDWARWVEKGTKVN